MGVWSDTSPAPEGSGGPVRVFIVDDQELVRDGLRSLLEQEGLDVVGECGSAREASRRIVERGTQVVVLDEHLPDGTGIEVCRDALSVDAGLKCLMLTSNDNDEALHSVVLAGAAGYVLRQLRGHQIAETILRAAASEPLLAPAKLAKVKTSLAKASLAAGCDDLTVEEKAVLALIAEDLNNRQISESLALDEATVRGLVSTLLAKLGFGGRTTVADKHPTISAPRKQGGVRPDADAGSVTSIPG